jgi:hypothetical protein
MEMKMTQLYERTKFNKESRGINLSRLETLLDQIDPDSCYPEWLRVLMAIFNESKGSEEGFNLANEWSSNGGSYKGEKEIRNKWRSFSLDTPNPITIATLYKMAKMQRLK